MDTAGSEEMRVLGRKWAGRRKGTGNSHTQRWERAQSRKQRAVMNTYLFLLSAVSPHPQGVPVPPGLEGKRFPCPSGICEHTRWELAQAAGTDALPEGKLQK